MEGRVVVWVLGTNWEMQVEYYIEMDTACTRDKAWRVDDWDRE